MKATKTIPHLLLASTLLFGAACSSTSTGAGSESTVGSGTGTGSASATNADNTATGGAVGAGSDMGSAETVTTAATAGASGAAAGTDMNAFMGTFATMPDATFLLTAASSNLLEIQAGQAAAQKATSADVKKFAQMMIDHHTKATQQMQAVATPLGVQPSQTLMPIHQAMLDKVNSKSGKDFDEAYMDAMETAHTMDIAMFQVKSKGAETPVVQAFATKTLPMLESHRKMAGDLEKKVD